MLYSDFQRAGFYYKNDNVETPLQVGMIIQDPHEMCYKVLRKTDDAGYDSVYLEDENGGLMEPTPAFTHECTTVNLPNGQIPSFKSDH